MGGDPVSRWKRRTRAIDRESIRNGFDGYVAMQSEPSLAPFGSPIQNAESDLDFSVTTASGNMLMELVEFAPLQAHGPTFAEAPSSLHPREKAALALERIHQKSDHHGARDRFLVVYTTEHGFWLDPMTIELLRRELTNNPPKFERVYYVSPHSLDDASVSEIYPGKPHHIIGDHSDEQLDQMRVQLPHPTSMIVGRTADWTQMIGVNGRPVMARFRSNISGISMPRRSSPPAIQRGLFAKMGPKKIR